MSDAAAHNALQKVVDTLRRYLENRGGTKHLIASIQVEVGDDGTAVTRAYVQARHQGLGPLAAENFDTNGEYADTWARRPEGRRIVNRVSRRSAMSGNPAVLFAQ